MSDPLHEETVQYVSATDEPAIRARQRQVARVILDINPDLREEERREGRKEGMAEGRKEGLAPLFHVYERRLGRRLTDDEQRTLSERLTTLGGDRLGDVVLDLAPDALAAWLADPGAI
jgi:hypothetical protein